jgi:hypothetical protein
MENAQNNVHARKRSAIINKPFDMEALKKQRQKKAQGTVDLVAALNAISPLIARLEPGQTAKLPLPEGEGGERKFIMGVTAKLTNVTIKGAAWAGRTYKVAGDGEGYVYVQRGQDGTAKTIKRGSGGGRRKKVAEAAENVTGGAIATVTGGEVSTTAPVPAVQEAAKVTEHA